MKPRPITLGTINDTALFDLTPEQRSLGVHIVGAPGSGKSKLMEKMIRDDLRSGAGGLVIDPHGELYRAVLAFCARHRLHRRIYALNVSAGQLICGFNPFAPRPDSDPSTRVLRCVTAVLKAWGIQNPDEAPRMLRWLKNTFAVAIERGDVSINELALLLRPENEAVRAYLAANTSVEAEWRQLDQLKRVAEFDEQVQSTKNRLDVLTSAKTTRRFLSLIDPTMTLDLSRAIEDGAFILVNLQPSPSLDPRNARLFGTMLLSEVFDAIRQRRLERNRPPRPFSVFVDEAQNFITHDVPELFAQGRKFGLYLTVAHQFLDQMRHEDERILAALNGAARTKIVFAVGSDTDAKELVHELFPGQVNYTELKHKEWQTKFRPVAARDTTITRSRGGGHAEGHGGNRSTTDGTTHTEGQSDGYTEGHDHGQSVANGTVHTTGHASGTNRAVAATHATGHAKTKSHSEGVTETEGHVVSHSGTTTHADVHTGTSASAVNATTSADPNVPDTTSRSSTNVHGYSISDTTSESFSETDSHNVAHTKGEGRAETESESDATTWSEGQSESESESDAETHTTASSEGWSESETSTQTESDAETHSETAGEDWSETNSQTWSESTSEGPATAHEEFQEGHVEFYTLEEQRQRLADMLRRLPQRVCIVRTPDGDAREVTVKTVEPVLLPARRIVAYELELAKKTGAIPAEEVDALIERRRAEIEDQARKFAAVGKRTVHCGDVPDDERPSPTLKRRAPKKATSEGKGGAEG